MILNSTESLAESEYGKFQQGNDLHLSSSGLLIITHGKRCDCNSDSLPHRCSSIDAQPVRTNHLVLIL